MNYGKAATRNDLVLEQYKREAGKYPRLTFEEEQVIWQRIKQGDDSAREELFLSNLFLVVQWAVKYAWGKRTGLDINDMIQEGNIGLMTAVEKWNGSRKLKFSTYATWWIKSFIVRSIMNMEKTIRVPIGVQTDMNKIIKAMSGFYEQWGREPELEEIIEFCLSKEELRLTRKKIMKAWRVMNGEGKTYFCLDELIGEEKNSITGRPRYEEYADQRLLNPEDVIFGDELKDVLAAALQQLPHEIDRHIIVRYKGWDGKPKETLEQIGKRLGLTRERIRQRKEAALKELATILREDFHSVIILGDLRKSVGKITI